MSEQSKQSRVWHKSGLGYLELIPGRVGTIDFAVGKSSESIMLPLMEEGGFKFTIPLHPTPLNIRRINSQSPVNVFGQTFYHINANLVGVDGKFRENIKRDWAVKGRDGKWYLVLSKTVRWKLDAESKRLAERGESVAAKRKPAEDTAKGDSKELRTRIAELTKAVKDLKTPPAKKSFIVKKLNGLKVTLKNLGPRGLKAARIKAVRQVVRHERKLTEIPRRRK
ncbi:MAG: hypothetical protein COV47_00475 [Candidatus Diapherotrites archaeon CG11_big_fil_rev_8_21_14_0_20_37_9]|nr:MAG: hypothetical protein COV47_00475 [Candidatus Diapherotrites archaeon CG11_big_fil_rev_8_21_14_0_20_37_9]